MRTQVVRHSLRYHAVAVGAIAAILFSSLLALGAGGVEGAFAFAAPAFQQQWQQGEALVPNFWGPLSTAHDGQSEPYQEATGGQRLVQYFDKGRMELTQPEENAPVTSGLLATELIKGQIQVGNNSFQPRPSPAIAIAGDPGSDTGATYANLGTNASTLLSPSQAKVGSVVTNQILPTGLPGSVALPPIAATTIISFDTPTQHNVPTAFANYRATAGLLNIGYAISEPFWATVKVAGASRFVMMQIFERRALTYTDSNPDPFKVEMGNIGQHYYQWRYSGNTGPTVPTTPLPPATTISAPTFTNIDDTSATVVYTTTFPACGTAEYQAPGDTTWTTDINTFSCDQSNATATQSVDLSGLKPNTTYTVRPAVKDVSQTVSYGPVGTFTTAPPTPVSISPLGISNLTKSSVTISFTTSVPTCAVVQYRVHGTQKWGADTDISSLNCKAADASMPHNKNLTGISPGSKLDVRAAVKNPTDQAIHLSQVVTFTTAA